jgi:hypothetical protein
MLPGERKPSKCSDVRLLQQSLVEIDSGARIAVGNISTSWAPRADERRSDSQTKTRQTAKALSLAFPTSALTNSPAVRLQSDVDGPTWVREFDQDESGRHVKSPPCGRRDKRGWR